jgi:hypothetical protein
MSCGGGVCECTQFGAIYCASEYTCVEIYSNEAHCGGCGKKCAAGQTCVQGSCV